MAKRVMERKAADNKYLHRDFHKSMDLGFAYLGEKYGGEGVKEYMREFASEYYTPLVDMIKKKGLIALHDHIKAIYEAEEMAEVLSLTLTDTTLDVKVEKCPAIVHFKRIGYTASPWYVEATRTINETIANMAGLTYRQHMYDEQDGKSEYTFAMGDI